MVENKFNLLRTKPEDEELHRSRIMFCIRGDNVEVSPSGTVNSHLEWFEEEGWVAKEDAREFLDQNIRGFYLSSTNSLYCYGGVGFFFDEEVIVEVKEKLGELREALDLKDDTKICFGPKDSVVGGREYPRHYEGSLSELLVSL